MSRRYTHLADLESTRPIQCQNCGWSGEEREAQAIADLEERIWPGEEVPVGECPDCGALCHYTHPEPKTTSGPVPVHAIGDPN